MLWRTLTTVAVVVLGAVALAADKGQNKTNQGVADEFTIDEYDFTWKVATIGTACLTVEKTQEKTLIGLRAGNGMSRESISMLPQDAEAIAAFLARTEEFYKKFRGQKGQSEALKTEKISVRFGTTDTGSFYVSVSPNERMTLSNVMLERKEASGIAPTMATSKKLAAFADKKINP